jgi:hypothetical protein
MLEETENLNLTTQYTILLICKTKPQKTQNKNNHNNKKHHKTKKCSTKTPTNFSLKLEEASVFVKVEQSQK